MQREKRLYIEPDQIIESCSYVPICDYQYAGQDDLPSGIVHCDICKIKEFFEKIDRNGKTYVVVSSSSDFGIYYQEQFPVWQDIPKAVSIFVRPQHGYTTQNYPPRCNLDQCKETDTFSIKCYSFTQSTFNKIPLNIIHWFVTNCGITEPRVSGIPFGILNKSNFISTINQLDNININSKSLYVNFQFYNKERHDLYYFFKSFRDTNITVEKEVDYSTYLRRLYEHKFCICPIGNGADGYRILECVYTGCIPIIELHPGLRLWIQPIEPLPIIVIDLLYKINGNILNEFYIENKDLPNYITFNYWKNKIQNAKSN